MPQTMCHVMPMCCTQMWTLRVVSGSWPSVKLLATINAKFFNYKFLDKVPETSKYSISEISKFLLQVAGSQASVTKPGRSVHPFRQNSDTEPY